MEELVFINKGFELFLDICQTALGELVVIELYFCMNEMLEVALLLAK